MSKAPTLPSYAVLTKAIQKFQPNANAAQVHGVLCGFVCAAIDESESHWEEAFPNIQDSKKTYELLQEITDASETLLSDFSFEFSLILPEEKADINIRAEALGLWCQGFLTGLELGHIPIQDREPGEVTEVLDDLLEIAEINFGDIAKNEEDESAYIELVEYARLGVLMIFHELRVDDEAHPIPEDENPLLH